MKERTPYSLQFDPFPALKREIDELKNTVKTQQEAVNAATTIIDELRKENELLKKDLYTKELDNTIAKYKNLYYKASDDYIKLSERYELLMSKYIKL